MLFTTSVINYKACQGNTITFKCSADAKPAVTSYHLFKNDTAIDVSLSGMWSETLASEGVLVYKCVAKNSLGTAASTDVSFTLNGKPFFFVLSYVNVLDLKTLAVNFMAVICSLRNFSCVFRTF